MQEEQALELRVLLGCAAERGSRFRIEQIPLTPLEVCAQALRSRPELVLNYSADGLVSLKRSIVPKEAPRGLDWAEEPVARREELRLNGDDRRKLGWLFVCIHPFAIVCFADVVESDSLLIEGKPVGDAYTACRAEE